MSNETQGIGIGLNTAETLASALGGELKILTETSIESHGTTISFKILTTKVSTPEKFFEDILIYKSRNKSFLDSSLVERLRKESSARLLEENMFIDFDIREQHSNKN